METLSRPGKVIRGRNSSDLEVRRDLPVRSPIDPKPQKSLSTPSALSEAACLHNGYIVLWLSIDMSKCFLLYSYNALT